MVVIIAYAIAAVATPLAAYAVVRCETLSLIEEIRNATHEQRLLWIDALKSSNNSPFTCIRRKLTDDLRYDAIRLIQEIDRELLVKPALNNSSTNIVPSILEPDMLLTVLSDVVIIGAVLAVVYYIYLKLRRMLKLCLKTLLLFFILLLICTPLCLLYFPMCATDPCVYEISTDSVVRFLQIWGVKQ